MALTLSEDLIRNRVGLEHDKLEDVKSLALPGTYHEKVVSLGSSLRQFSRLKHLDLSRNNITSLQGLEHLKLLEKLNLYYNNIESLEELKRLKHNPNLKELDLRLNPVTRTETDYRLYLIHMLPNLQKLDDRGVRDRERQGALIHFSSCQATEMTVQPRQEPVQTKPLNPRAEHVKNLGNPKLLDDDDVELLDLIARTSGDLTNARPLTGSSNTEPSVEDYSIQGLKELSKQPEDILDKRAAQKKPHVIPHPQQGRPGAEQGDGVISEYKKRYPNIPDVIVSDSNMQKLRDPNLEFDDETEAYNKFKSHGFFTPTPHVDADDTTPVRHPSGRESPSHSRVHLERTRGADPAEDLDEDRHRRSYSVPADRLQYENVDKAHVERYSDEPERSSDQPADHSSQKYQPSKGDTPESRLFLFQLLDLVDRYWNGSKSLHKNNKFKGLAYGAINDYLRTVADDKQRLETQQLRDEVTHMRRENQRLRRNEELTKSSLEENTATESHLKASLQKAFTDVEMLKDKVQSYASENKRLQQKLKQMESYNAQPVHTAPTDGVQIQNEQLKRELDKQHIQLKQFKQLQELSSMLQESHKSLVQTNDHLLKELEQTRQRHQHEVEQLNWSYNQLKKTMVDTSRLPQQFTTLKGEGNSSAVMYDSDR